MERNRTKRKGKGREKETEPNSIIQSPSQSMIS